MKPEVYKKIVSKNLKRIRESKGLSASMIAEILGVSQAKVSYIEHCKGVLSVVDVAILSRKLNIPVTEFFAGINDEDDSGIDELVQQLSRFGAVLLAKRRGIIVDAIPFEEVFTRTLGFLEDERLHQGFLAALIIQANSHEILVDRIFAEIGSSPFLVARTLAEAQLASRIIDQLATSKRTRDSVRISRAQGQINKIIAAGQEILATASWKVREQKYDNIRTEQTLPEFVKFVEECLHAQK